jgi:hypothetical protein
MGENNKSKPVAEVVKFTDPDVQARDTFIGIALRELIAQAITNKQMGQYAVTADHAVRYADAVMVSRAKEFKATVTTGGRGAAVRVAAPPPQPEAPDLTDLTKAIGELVGEGELPPSKVPTTAQQNANLPPLAEVK